MSGFDGQPVYYVYQNLQNDEALGQNVQTNLQQALEEYKKFFQNWLINNQKVYILSMSQAYESGKKAFNVLLEDICIYNDHYYQYLINKPNEFTPILERAASEAFYASTNKKYQFQVLLISTQYPKNLRDIKASSIGKLITVSGIITHASKPYIRSKEVYVECSKCHHVKQIEVSQGLGSVYVPAFCERQGPITEKCPRDSYVIITENCTVFDQQRLKLQESPESIPTGEIPRTFSLCVERSLINKFSPGTRVILTGIYQVLERKVLTEKYISQNQQKMNYIQVVGYQLEDEVKRKNINFTNSEEEKFKEMSKDPFIYEKIAQSIAPSIYGHENIKKAIACLLFGGSKKLLQDGLRLRGDINIGDPSTGKSQFLKFVQRIASNAIYTSGKGSSASGLTASITKDLSTGEFQIEGGAMVLADGGVVCIDEFDKMRAEDRVAIHEAMEQQTVSIAKAGITTKLNTRCSVLAAANPIFGSYNDMQSVDEQIELQTTILSRFDSIFIVRDPKTKDNDMRIADHVLNLHMNNNNKKHMEEELDQENQSEIDLETLRKYIAYAKAKIHPRLTERSSEKIQNLYVEDRKLSQQGKSSKKNHIPITVRQLEAIIRLSEAIAKIQLSEDVNEDHINKAHELFQYSTMNAIQNGRELGFELPQELQGLSLKIEEAIKRRVAINSKVDCSKLKEEMVIRWSNQRAVEYTINNMIKNQDFRQIEGKKVLLRIK
ncbi:mcm2-3-5 family protein, putative [Ichthyophthirius multifiliis]|uniref:DNA replication licensing factor MCM5 n=1 Tax=Ichthyophthirius multifiliis TaxID=5932 RepID=G0QSK6_ICHMU|nr:mcm2-3-5 family protein, putative [Ichthyophthirius multifiliis]EGR31798.1 mcm2-3-5 family protein, putative [Ichthyophthirius multifiliis]|eukprot:XP_004035284.1 mcm2-3-5 family protein, putative [Ichthyophthirius multifiliis]